MFASNVMPVFEQGKKGLSRYALFVDFSKAFDSVCRQSIVSKLRDRFGVNVKILNMIAALLQENEMRLCNLRSNEKPKIKQNVGVQQGDSLSPLLFILFTDDLLAFLKHKFAGKQIHSMKHADDLCVVTTTAIELKFVLRCLQAWCEVNEMNVNVNMTGVMKIRRGGRLAASDSFTFAGKPLQIVNNFTYLGVNFSTTMKVSKHVQTIKQNSVSAINAMRNLGSVCLQTLLAKRIFLMKIVPIVRYAVEFFLFWFEHGTRVILFQISDRLHSAARIGTRMGLRSARRVR